MQKAQTLHTALLTGPGGALLFIAELEELLLQLLATKDAAGAPSPDELAPELALEES
ncbi:hypothetical protein C0993_003724, partial [Termitomyces sp. T159_Od127]